MKKLKTEMKLGVELAGEKLKKFSALRINIFTKSFLLRNLSKIFFLLHFSFGLSLSLSLSISLSLWRITVFGKFRFAPRFFLSFSSFRKNWLRSTFDQKSSFKKTLNFKMLEFVVRMKDDIFLQLFLRLIL